MALLLDAARRGVTREPDERRKASDGQPGPPGEHGSFDAVRAISFLLTATLNIEPAASEVVATEQKNMRDRAMTLVANEFRDSDLSPHPAVGKAALFGFLDLLNEHFVVLHWSGRLDAQNVMTHVDLRSKKGSGNDAPIAGSHMQETWTWAFDREQIVGRAIYLRAPAPPQDRCGKARSAADHFFATLKAMRASYVLVLLFATFVNTSPAIDLIRMIVGAPGNGTTYSWLIGLVPAALLTSIVVAYRAYKALLLFGDDVIVPARIAGRRLWYPPNAGWQVALALIPPAVFLASLVTALLRAAAYIDDRAIVHHVWAHSTLLGFFAAMFALMAVLLPFSGRIAANPFVVSCGALAMEVGYLILFLALPLASNDPGSRYALIIFVMWMGSMVLLLGLLAELGDRTRIPVLSILLAWILMLSWTGWDDHHGVATRPAKVVAPQVSRALTTWLAAPAAEPQPSDPPIFVVAAEGGGIRAAVMTAKVLDELRWRYPGFPDHVFALVGVSGGSVGVSAFATALHQDAPPIPVTGPDPVAPVNWQASLQSDLLSPAVFSLLGGDLWSRLVPQPIVDLSRHDRASALENAWAQNWLSATKTDISELWFQDLAPGAYRRVPALVLLTTSTRTGRRMAVSHLSFKSAKTACPTNNSVQTLADVNKNIDVPLKTAAFMSARFPIISPAARVTGTIGVEHYVDGGYFENSGLSTALDLVDAIRCTKPDANIVIIRIENSEAKAASDRPQTARFFDIMGPVAALYATGDAHGEAAGLELERRLAAARIAAVSNCKDDGKGKSRGKREAPKNKCRESPSLNQVRFRLAPPPLRSFPVPLSWFISAAVRAEIARQLLLPDNQQAFDDVGRLLQPPTSAKKSGLHIANEK